MFRIGKKQELDDFFARVMAVIENYCDEASSRIKRLEDEHSIASERMNRLEEAHLASSRRMDRIETILESNTISIKELNTAAFKVFNVMSLSQKNFEVIQENFEIMVSQVKGIQAENRNIFNHLFDTKE
jgi:predicted nuclease with TOPRIM domain